MMIPRIVAAVFVFLLIATLALAAIGGIASLGPALAHGNTVQHQAGTIVAMGPGTDFVLETASGQDIHFSCKNRCLTVTSHIQRHLREHAHTDVYYIQAGQNSLVAVDVD